MLPIVRRTMLTCGRWLSDERTQVVRLDSVTTHVALWMEFGFGRTLRAPRCDGSSYVLGPRNIIKPVMMAKAIAANQDMGALSFRSARTTNATAAKPKANVTNLIAEFRPGRLGESSINSPVWSVDRTDSRIKDATAVAHRLAVCSTGW